MTVLYRAALAAIAVVLPVRVTGARVVPSCSGNARRVDAIWTLWPGLAPFCATGIPPLEAPMLRARRPLSRLSVPYPSVLVAVTAR